MPNCRIFRPGRERALVVAALLVAATLLVAASVGGASEGGPFGPMVVMNIKGLVLDPISAKPIAVLETEEKPHRLLPIWIGRFEANAIALEMEQVPALRPMTHDLIKNILQGLEARVRRIVVTKLQDNIFYAVIMLEMDGRELQVDSRPSDAIAVALRVGAPIYATEKVLEDAQSIEVPEHPEASVSKDAFGMTVQALTPAIAEHFSLPEGNGVLVSNIRQDGRAQAAGIRRGDIITSLGEMPTGSLKAFEEAASAAEGLDNVAVRVRRGEADHDLTLILGNSGE